MVYPKPLKPGDRIAVVSPASAVETAYVDAACRTIEGWGYVPVEGKHCRQRHGTYSATADERLSDLNEAIADPSVRAILCSRGGYGAVHLVGNLDIAALQRDPKWLIGFSDISALHATFVSNAVASIHGLMAKHMADCGEDDECLKMLRAILEGGKPVYNEPPHPLNRHGEAEGTLVGGNLAVLCGLISTPVDILKPGTILFIEDVGEAVYRIERMLYNLNLNGTLPHVKALIVGQFTEYQCPDGNGETMEQMIARMTAPYSFPVAYGFPIGHVARNMPLIEGATVHLSVTTAATTLEYLENQP